MYRVELKEKPSGGIISEKEEEPFLMYRVELKDIIKPRIA